jgi:hypothetical protein
VVAAMPGVLPSHLTVAQHLAGGTQSTLTAELVGMVQVGITTAAASAGIPVIG